MEDIMKRCLLFLIAFVVSVSISTALSAEGTGVSKTVPARTIVTAGSVELEYGIKYIVEHSGCHVWYIISTINCNGKHIVEKFGCYKKSRDWKCPYPGIWEVQFTNYDYNERHMYIRFIET
jgi:hypothetical protein